MSKTQPGSDQELTTEAEVEITVDGNPIVARSGTPLLVSLLERDLHPTGGGCLCFAGDCGHCLATVDGVSYVRTCQTRVGAGQEVLRSHRNGAQPPLLTESGAASAAPELEHRHCDVVVIGQGRSGQAEAVRQRALGLEVLVLDAAEDQHVAGIYPELEVLVRSACGMELVHARKEVVVATGSAEIQPLGLGTELSGLVTARACERLAKAGVNQGRIVAVGEPPASVPGVEQAPGQFLRCEPAARGLGADSPWLVGVDVDGASVYENDSRVQAVVTLTQAGKEVRTPCDTVSFGLGLHPRDALLRMGRGLAVRGVGSVAEEGDLPLQAAWLHLGASSGSDAISHTVSSNGSGNADRQVVGAAASEVTLCACAGVKVGDIASVWERGFRELELVKRATLAGTGTCQGSACLPHLRGLLKGWGKELQPPFTARPLTRQLTIEQIAAGAHHTPTLRTPLHEEHLASGASMHRSGGCWRAWDYGDVAAERLAVREAVSLGDVSTLGKFLVAGPDALRLLNLLYPTEVSTLGVGRSRYALLLNERGTVVDDGVICREDEQRFFLTLTSAGATFGELWLRDWAEARGFDVTILNQTHSLGAINVTGPLAAELLSRVGLQAPSGSVDVETLPSFAGHRRLVVAGIDCRVLRLSFTGELSYELHHAASESVRLWRALMEGGTGFGVRPHGLDALLRLRLEKGHIVVGQDTDFDSTPRRLDHAWAANLSKPEFVGKGALLRTNQRPLDRQLVGLVMHGGAPAEGAPLWSGGGYAGYVTSSTESPLLGQSVMLAWLALIDGVLPQQVEVGDREAPRLAQRVTLPFVDPEGKRSKRAVERAPVLRSSIRVGSDGSHSEYSGRPGDRIEGGVALARQAWGRFERVEATRIAAAPARLAAVFERSGLLAQVTVLASAPDEAIALADQRRVRRLLSCADLQSVLVERETGFAHTQLLTNQASVLLSHGCAWYGDWEAEACGCVGGAVRFGQGAAWEIPIKLWTDGAQTELLVQASLAAALERRMWLTERALAKRDFASARLR